MMLYFFIIKGKKEHWWEYPLIKTRLPQILECFVRSKIAFLFRNTEHLSVFIKVGFLGEYKVHIADVLQDLWGIRKI